MNNKKILKISGLCLLVEGIISAIVMFIINFAKKDEVINGLKEQLSSLSVDVNSLASIFFIIAMVGTIISLLIHVLVSKKAIDYANEKIEKTGFITISIIFAIIGGTNLINATTNNLTGIISFIFNFISTVIYLFVFYFGNKIKKEKQESDLR